MSVPAATFPAPRRRTVVVAIGLGHAVGAEDESVVKVEPGQLPPVPHLVHRSRNRVGVDADELRYASGPNHYGGAVTSAAEPDPPNEEVDYPQLTCDEHTLVVGGKCPCSL